MRKLALAVIPAAVAVAAASPALASPSASSINVTEKEFKMTPSATSAKAGQVTFKVVNKGALDHTLEIVKTSLAASKLPVKSEKVTLKPLGKAGPFKPGKSGTLKITLKAGKYVLFCNIAGHYKAGQYVAFTVK
jgi:uncharacterized cupredoxin-like copper-binding protein